MCRGCQWEELSTQIEKLLDSGFYRWARKSLDGIYRTVNQDQHCTEIQRGAVENIRDSLGRRRQDAARRARSGDLFRR